MESDPIDLDLYSRKVVGWAMGAKADTALHQAALSMAITQRQPQAGLIHHTDRGAVYSAAPYRAQLAQTKMLASMNGKKTAYDNAVAESFFSNLKNEGYITMTLKPEKRQVWRYLITSSAFITHSVFISR